MLKHSLKNIPGVVRSGWDIQLSFFSPKLEAKCANKISAGEQTLPKQQAVGDQLSWWWCLASLQGKALISCCFCSSNGAKSLPTCFTWAAATVSPCCRPALAPVSKVAHLWEAEYYIHMDFWSFWSCLVTSSQASVWQDGVFEVPFMYPVLSCPSAATAFMPSVWYF